MARAAKGLAGVLPPKLQPPESSLSDAPAPTGVPLAGCRTLPVFMLGIKRPTPVVVPVFVMVGVVGVVEPRLSPIIGTVPRLVPMLLPLAAPLVPVGVPLPLLAGGVVPMGMPLSAGGVV